MKIFYIIKTFQSKNIKFMNFNKHKIIKNKIKISNTTIQKNINLWTLTIKKAIQNKIKILNLCKMLTEIINIKLYKALTIIKN